MSHLVLQPHPIDALFATIIDFVLPFYMARAAILGLIEACIPATTAKLASVGRPAGSGAAAIDKMRPFLHAGPSCTKIPRYRRYAMVVGGRADWRPSLAAMKQAKWDRASVAAALTRDLKRDWQGLWQLTDPKVRLRDELRAYFRSRDEDSTEI
jgi:hypothetical protein